MTTAHTMPTKHTTPTSLLNLHLVETQLASNNHHASLTPAHLDSYGCYSCSCEVEGSVQSHTDNAQV